MRLTTPTNRNESGHHPFNGFAQEEDMKAKERLINACLNKTVDRPPVWVMRQAGRYLPEYRSLKAKHSTKHMMTTPSIAAEITTQPVSILGVDAAILYSDILMICDAMGLGLHFITGEGPQFDFCVRDCDAVNRLHTDNINEKLSFVFETIKLCHKKLPKDFPIIGFAGGPFTVAAYMFSGNHQLNFSAIKNFAWTQPKVYEQLLDIITQLTIDYLLAQSRAGVAVVQVFDTWAGQLSCDDYALLAKPFSQRVFRALQEAYVPSIHYVLNGFHLLPEMIHVPSDALGIDWRTGIDVWKKHSHEKFAIQGNFDPDVLLTTPALIEERLQKMADSVKNPRKGFIVNLGHGVKPETPVRNMRFFVEKAKTFF